MKSRDPATTESLAVAGYDFIVADLEHSSLSAGDVEGIVRACDACDVPVIARIPASGLGLCGQLLDLGVTGLQVSDVTSAATALSVRAAAHYPPVGERSLSLSTRAARFGAVPASAHIPASLAQTVLVGQIESREGLAAVAPILDTQVFDALFFGPADLSVSLREPGRGAVHPDVASLSLLSEATSMITGSGTALGIFCASADEARRWASRGLTLLAISTDLGMLRQGAESVLGAPDPLMKITIAGAGAMGCRFGAALAAGHEVLLLDGWRSHVEAISARGLRVTDEAGTRTVPVRAALFPAAPDPADLLIVFAKATATASVAAAAAGAIGPRTLVLTLQNGLGNIEALLPHVPRDRLLAGTTTLGTELIGPGHVRALGSGETVLGSLGPASHAERTVADLAAAGIVARATADPLAVIWSKVAFNCVMNSLCTIASIPVSALAVYPGFDSLAGTILDEVATVAAAEGVQVDVSAALALMKAQFDPAASGNHLASTLQDLLNRRPTEIAHLNGAIAARALVHGLPAPANTLITQLVQLLEATHDRRVTAIHP